MHRYKEDYALMEKFGIKAYRFSISWARLIPDGTRAVNQKAVDLYRDMILTMKAHGIEPYLTMYHWEFPQTLQDRGGWLNEDVIEWSERHHERFGIVHVDFETQKRIPKDSAYWYRDVIVCNGRNLHINQKL